MTTHAQQDKAALVIGASGSLGSAFVKQLSESGQFAAVLGTSRHGQDAHAPIALDIEHEDQFPVSAALVADQLKDAGLTLHTVLIATGILHGDDIRPERRISELDAAAFTRVMQINALGPLLAVRTFLPLLPRESSSRMAVISARVGSISDNKLGGWYSYRCSKAALNMGFKTLAIEVARTHPKCVITMMQPGTVDSALSQPFKAGQKQANIKTPMQSASELLQVLDQRNDPKAHGFVDWAGQDIPY